jgi:hypothetical protein
MFGSRERGLSGSTGAFSFRVLDPTTSLTLATLVATSAAMDNLPQMGSASDLEMRAARIADPGIGQYNYTIFCR